MREDDRGWDRWLVMVNVPVCDCMGVYTIQSLAWEK